MPTYEEISNDLMDEPHGLDLVPQGWLDVIAEREQLWKWGYPDEADPYDVFLDADPIIGLLADRTDDRDWAVSYLAEDNRLRTWARTLTRRAVLTIVAGEVWEPQQIRQDKDWIKDATTKGIATKRPVDLGFDEFVDWVGQRARAWVETYTKEHDLPLRHRPMPVEDADLARSLQKHAHRLPTRQREVLGLVAQGLSYNDIARQLRISRHAVKQAAYRGRRTLRVALP